MLEKVNKFAPWAAVGIIAYLAYSAVTTSGLVVEQEKDTPTIPAEALNPKLVEPADMASPAGRDPFDVHWATYRCALPEPKLIVDEPDPPTTQSADNEPTTQPAKVPPQLPGPPNPRCHRCLRNSWPWSQARTIGSPSLTGTPTPSGRWSAASIRKRAGRWRASATTALRFGSASSGRL